MPPPCAAMPVLEPGVCNVGELWKQAGGDVTALSSVAKPLGIRSKTDLKLAERMKELLEIVPQPAILGARPQIATPRILNR